MSSSLVTKIYRYLWVSAWYAIAAVVVLLATGFAIARLLLPFADQYSAEVGERFSDYLNQPVIVRALDAEWHGWGPSLVLRDLSLLDEMGEQPVLRLEKVRLGLNLLSSLRQRQIVFSDITFVGVNLVLTRDQQGQFSVVGLPSQLVENKTKKNLPRQSEDVKPFLTWLFSQDQLNLEDSDITWQDEMGAGRKMHFSAVNLSLRNDGNRHQLDAALTLSSELGKSMILRIDMWGDPMSTKRRSTQVFIAGEHVHLAELFEPQSIAGVNVSIDSAGFRVWGQWKEGILQYLTGDVDAAGLTMVPGNLPQNLPQKKPQSIKPETLLLDRMAGTFSWRRHKSGWLFEGDELMLARDSREWQPSRVSLNIAERVSGQPTVDAVFSYLQLEDISELLTLFSVGGEKLQQPLQAIAARGDIKNAHLHWQGGETMQYQVYAGLHNASLNAWQNIPAAESVDGQLWLTATNAQASGQIDLQHASVTLRFPSLFRWPMPVDELRGNVTWAVNDDQWRIAGRNLALGNEDISASISLDIIQDAANDSPFMSLIVDFKDGDGSQIARYLPTGAMSEDAISWLDEAFVRARIVSGGAVFHGMLNNFPFDDGDGKFELAFSVEDASLNYANDWPPITAIKADVRFEGRGMFINMQRGDIYSNQIRWANVGIVDMSATPLLLTIDGEIQGSTQEKLDYLVASPPLYAAFGQHLEDMSTTGDSILKLELHLPIGTDDETEVSGWVDLTENSLSIPPLGRVLSEMTGRLNFFQDGLQAENIETELLGQPTKINVATGVFGSSRKVRISANGLFDAPDLAAHYAPVMVDFLEGDGAWNILFDIPLDDDADTSGDISNNLSNNTKPSQPATLYVQSNLKGVATKLPSPFDKQAEDAGSLELRVQFFSGQSPVLQINYGGTVDSIIALNGLGSPDELRAEVRFNAGIAVLPDTPGLRVLGWLDTVSLDEWRYLLPNREAQLMPASAAGAQQQSTTSSPFRILDSADVAARVFEAYGQQIHNARVKLTNQDNALLVDVNSKEIKGTVMIPYDLKTNPVIADLAYSYLVEPEVGEGAMDPRDMPALDIRIKDFRYLKLKLGAVRLETTKVVDGVRIEQLILKPRATTVTARGGWYMRGKKQQSNLQMHLKSSNFGRTLKALDYVGGIDDGKGTIDVELKWPGSFADVDASGIQGKLKMSLSDGYVLDIDPGAGRMFGMLSVQALPRRLLLDFSDVFKKGFGFDRIKGNFTIEDGDAYTNNFYMKGPAARVDIAGRTGLEAQDYDQLVTVTPHVSETLPVLGILGATPQIGAVILLAQKIFKPTIDDATKTQYTITGSWNAPVIKKVKSSQSADDAIDDSLDDEDL